MSSLLKVRPLLPWRVESGGQWGCEDAAREATTLESGVVLKTIDLESEVWKLNVSHSA
jgi:hypothetical protein